MRFYCGYYVCDLSPYVHSTRYCHELMQSDSSSCTWSILAELSRAIWLRGCTDLVRIRLVQVARGRLGMFGELN